MEKATAECMKTNALLAMPPDEIRNQNAWPAGFLPLPHPHHETGGMIFPKPLIDETKKQTERDLTRFDLDFDLPDHMLPELPAAIFLVTLVIAGFNDLPVLRQWCYDFSEQTPDGAKCHSVQVHPTSAEWLVVGLSGGGVCVSRDCGATCISRGSVGTRWSHDERGAPGPCRTPRPGAPSSRPTIRH